MQSYHYQAIDRIGQAVQGRIDAENPHDATAALAQQGRFVKEITPVQHDAEDAVTALTAESSIKPHLSVKNRTCFIRHLATALQAHLPLVTAL